MQDELASVTGYYAWEGFPCEVRHAAQEPTVLEAVMYVEGQGFQPAPLSSVITQGVPVTKEAFRAFVMRLSQSRRQAPS